MPGRLRNVILFTVVLVAMVALLIWRAEVDAEVIRHYENNPLPTPTYVPCSEPIWPDC